MFIKSCISDYPSHSLPEIALVGRSNSGKSSFLNSITGKKLARVSKTPGKTNLLNFYDLKKYVLVDMPGYGYAKRSLKEIHKWKNMVENYLLFRKPLKTLILLMDIRRSLTADEFMLVSLAKKRSLLIYLILSKADKIKNAKLKVIEIKNSAKIEYVFAHSSKDAQSVKLMRKLLEL